jgi:ferritin
MIKPHKLPSEIASLLNDRIKDEYNAFYFYRSASNWCRNVGFMKAADFFAEESSDESSHAKKIEDFLVQWNMTPELPSIAKPQLSFTSLPEIIRMAYEIEYDLYEKYEDTSVKIMKIGDVCVFDFLSFFRSVQTNAVAEYSDKINILSGVDPTKINLLLIEENLF